MSPDGRSGRGAMTLTRPLSGPRLSILPLMLQQESNMEPWALVPCVRPLGQRGLFVHTRCRLYLVLRSRSIEIVFWAKTQQMGFLKNHFCATLRHLRSTWDVRTKVFDEANSILEWLKLHYHYLGSYCSKYLKNENEAWVTKDLDAPRRDILICSIFNFVVALSVSRQIDF